MTKRACNLLMLNSEPEQYFQPRHRNFGRNTRMGRHGPEFEAKQNGGLAASDKALEQKFSPFRPEWNSKLWFLLKFGNLTILFHINYTIIFI